MPPQGALPPAQRPPPPNQTSTVSIPPALSLPSTSKQTPTFGHDRQPSVQLKIEASGGPPLLSRVCFTQNLYFLFTFTSLTTTFFPYSLGHTRWTCSATFEALFWCHFYHSVSSLTRCAIDLSTVDFNLPGAIQRRSCCRFFCFNSWRIYFAWSVVPHCYFAVVSCLSWNSNLLFDCRSFDSFFLQQPNRAFVGTSWGMFFSVSCWPFEFKHLYF